MNTIESASIGAKSMPERSEMMRALFDRDRSYDGLFFAGVTTTMIFCRPSCPARKPHPENVEFYPTAREALVAGFRPCGRCRPMEQAERSPSWLRSLLERVDADPSARLRDEDLITMGLQPATVRRYFQKEYGMTFHGYCRARRLGAAFVAIRRGGSIDDAVFDHGWESHSGFRDAFSKAAQVAPGAARSRDFIRLAWIDTVMGPMIAGATEEAVCLLEFADRRMMETQIQTLRRCFRLPMLPGDNRLLTQLRAELSEYFEGKRRTFDLPLDYRGTPFQEKVWKALLSIPYGETRCYGDIARDLGRPSAPRAVGHANGQNRIAILIPCHRVVNADGGIGGYGGGLWRKLRLLEMEEAVPGT